MGAHLSPTRGWMMLLTVRDPSSHRVSLYTPPPYFSQPPSPKCWGLNTGPCIWRARALPLSYNPGLSAALECTTPLSPSLSLFRSLSPLLPPPPPPYRLGTEPWGFVQAKHTLSQTELYPQLQFYFYLFVVVIFQDRISQCNQPWLSWICF